MRPASVLIDAAAASLRCTRLGAFDDGVRHLLHLRREVALVEQHDGLGGLLHLVDGVVHRGDQILDVAAVERRDEGAPHRDQHLARDVVGVVLAVHHGLVVARHGVAAFEHGAQRLGAGDDRFGMLGKQIEEALFLRHQGVKPAQHGRPRVQAIRLSTPSSRGWFGGGQGARVCTGMIRRDAGRAAAAVALSRPLPAGPCRG